MDKLSNYQPDVGINRISRVATPAMELPARRDAQLTGQPIRQEVNDLFPGGQLAQTIRDFASPVLREHSVVLPRRNDGLIRQSAASLEQYEASAEPGDPALPALRRANALLKDEIEMRDLLHQYRVSLMQA